MTSLPHADHRGSFHTVVRGAGAQAKQSSDPNAGASQSNAQAIIMMCVLRGDPQHPEEILPDDTCELSRAWAQFETQSYTETSGRELPKRSTMLALSALKIF